MAVGPAQGLYFPIFAFKNIRFKSTRPHKASKVPYRVARTGADPWIKINRIPEHSETSAEVVNDDRDQRAQFDLLRLSWDRTKINLIFFA